MFDSTGFIIARMVRIPFRAGGCGLNSTRDRCDRFSTKWAEFSNITITKIAQHSPQFLIDYMYYSKQEVPKLRYQSQVLSSALEVLRKCAIQIYYLLTYLQWWALTTTKVVNYCS